MNSRTGVIVIARNGSTRSPAKMLADIAGRPLLDRLLDRVMAGSDRHPVVLATTCRPEDRSLAALARDRGALIYHGSSDDVLERMLGALHTWQLDRAVIVEGDELFTEPAHVRQLLRKLPGADADLIRITGTPIGSWVLGLRREALARIYATGYSTSDAWSTLFSPEKGFAIDSVPADPPCEPFPDALRLTMDYPEDLELAREIYRQAGEDIPSLQNVVRLIGSTPAMLGINTGVAAGYWQRLADTLDSDPARQRTLAKYREGGTQ